MAQHTITILGLGGSFDPESSSQAALRVALAGAREAGAETELIDVGALRLPLFDPTQEAPAEAIAFAQKVHAADGMIWSSPLYHGTISGLFKNTLDWLDLLQKADPPFLTHKFIGMICTAGGAQGLQAINTMEFVVRALRGWGAPLVAPISRGGSAFGPDGKPVDPKIEAQLKHLGGFVAESCARWKRGAG